jgi:RNA polymerase sigma factor (TIGR02999 family)
MAGTLMAAGEITRLIEHARSGDREAWDRLLALLYADLRRIAARYRPAGERTLDTTSLVHECYLRLANAGELELASRKHFFALAARVMRQLVCDYARERLAQKRGGGIEPLPLADNESPALEQARHCLLVDEALADLLRHDERQARVVECRFFGGLTEQETAEALEISVRSVQRDWQTARAWLAERLRA